MGVPTVIDITDEQGEPFMAVPRDIDVVVNHYADVISKAVNHALNPGLNESEIERLMV